MPSAAGFLADLRSLNMGNWFERSFLSLWASQERSRLQCYCQLQMLNYCAGNGVGSLPSQQHTVRNSRVWILAVEDIGLLATFSMMHMMNMYCVTRCTKSGNSRNSYEIVAYLNCHNT
jgi:hypothetical protein